MVETRMCCRNSFPLRGSTSPLARCGGTMLLKKPLGPPYSPHALTQCEMSWFHYWCPRRRRPNLYKQGWGNLHNLIGGSQQDHEASPQWNMALRWPQPSRVLKHPRVTRSARDKWGNQISLGGSVDRSLVTQSRANQQVWLARERDRAKMELGATMELWGKEWRKYALEAIIKLLFISLYHDKCLLFMLELY